MLELIRARIAPSKFPTCWSKTYESIHISVQLKLQLHVSTLRKGLISPHISKSKQKPWNP